MSKGEYPTIATETALAFAYKQRQNYQFTKDLQRCFNVTTKKELKLVTMNRCLGFNVGPESSFKSLTFIKQNLIELKKIKSVTNTSIITAINKEYNCTFDELLSRSTKGDLSFAKKTWALILQKYISNNLSLVGQIMGLSRVSVYAKIQEGEALKNSNTAFRNHLNNIEINL